jgi:hypothetical protein
VLEFRCADADWEGALAILDVNRQHGFIDKPTYERHGAVLLTARALALEESDPGVAKLLAVEATRFAPDLVPAAALAGRLLGEAGETRWAGKILQTAWRANPHPHLAEAYADLRPGESARDRLARVRALVREPPGHVEGSLALARAALDARELVLARQCLEALLLKPTQRAATLMAELKELQHGDVGRAREWDGASVASQSRSTWTADGFVSGRWLPLSPVTGRLDAFEWKVPLEEVTGPARVTDEPGEPVMTAPGASAAPTPATPATPAARPTPQPPRSPGPGAVAPAADAQPSVRPAPTPAQTGAVEPTSRFVMRRTIRDPIPTRPTSVRRAFGTPESVRPVRQSCAVWRPSDGGSVMKPPRWTAGAPARPRAMASVVEEAEKEALPAEPPAPSVADPATAGPGDRLEGGLIVKRRLGRDGSAFALLVDRGGSGEELVLKVALDDAHADRIRVEADVLRRLHHQNIVRFVDEITASGRPAILMERAGDKTLAQWIRGGDPLSLDLMRRFGEHLLSAIEKLEQEGIAHRDVKPDNIGIAKSAGSGAYRLVLSDFSLSRAPVETITAGTRPYLEPFLPDRRPPRWDLHAERYAAAVTLHEMLTGTPPSFGDGLTEPRLTEDEATIAIDRDGLLSPCSQARSRRVLRECRGDAPRLAGGLLATRSRGAVYG